MPARPDPVDEHVARPGEDAKSPEHEDDRKPERHVRVHRLYQLLSFVSSTVDATSRRRLLLIRVLVLAGLLLLAVRKSSEEEHSNNSRNRYGDNVDESRGHDFLLFSLISISVF